MGTPEVPTDKGEWSLLLRYAAVALGVLGGTEWLLGRTISRMAASPALEGTPRTIIESLGRIGIFLLPVAFVAAALVFFLSTTLFGWESSYSVGSRRRIALSMYLSLFGAVTIAASFLPSTSWLTTAYSLLSLLAILAVYVQSLSVGGFSREARIATAMTMLAYLGWFTYISLEEAAASMGWDGVPVLVLNLGELVALLTPIAFFVAVAIPGGEWRNAKRWIFPVVLALLFAAGNIADMAFDQGLTGVFTLWSVGFTHFLPWPLYALALAAFAYAVLTCFSRDGQKAAFANPNTGLGLLLLLFAGYNLQLTYQHLLALLAMMLFTGLAKPFPAPSAEMVEVQSTQQEPTLALTGVVKH